MMLTDTPHNHQAPCQCHKLPTFIHEIAQSLQIIYLYLGSCNNQLKQNCLDIQQLGCMLEKIAQHTLLIETSIKTMRP